MAECIKSHFEDKLNCTTSVKDFSGTLAKYFPALFKHCLSIMRHIQQNIKVPVGMRYRSCLWIHLQPSTSIFKYSPTSRNLILIFFCQLQLHLHMGLTILLSLDVYVYFFPTKLAPLLEKKNEMVIWDSSWTLDGLFFFMIQGQPHGRPQKKRTAFLFRSSCILGHCWLLCHSACIVLMSYGFFFLTINNAAYPPLVRGQRILCPLQKRNCTV